ncbi:MAG: RagB/SusD family nutrient uptake outer membrane protein [Bacteroidaceae bacterium]|nr:RagB/SusD family nutrient uptake outer membrane protein [Bacteroidaceae bacterium]
MKNRLYIIIAILAGIFTLSSCSDWLDVSPKTNVPAEELFETENGYMSALAGIYISMTGDNIYGKNLTFGLMEQLAQMYDKLPDGTNDRASVYIYNQQTSGGFNTKSALENMWQSQYNLIANTNNLLKWLDTNGDIVLEENTHNMIRGEALALRAHLHFDLLRGWGPVNYAGNPDARNTKCIPYRTVTDDSKQPLLAAGEVVEKIINDLVQAKSFLSYEAALDLSEYEGTSRRYRLNYHAVNALLARVYNYAGLYEEAKVCALEVIENCGLELQSANDNDPILTNEVIFGINMYELKDNLSDYFAVGEKMTTKYYLNISTLNSIFESVGSESEDMRAKGTAFYRNNEQQNAISLKYIDNDNEIIPLIRLPEMYYIACEAAEYSTESAAYINLVRNKRGISRAKDVACDTDEQRTAALNKEYRKEFYGEGQYFWFLKTHGATGTLAHCPDVTLVEENFIFPLPDAELEYGWTEENDAADDNEGNTREDEQTGNEGVITPRI